MVKKLLTAVLVLGLSFLGGLMYLGQELTQFHRKQLETLQAQGILQFSELNYQKSLFLIKAQYQLPSYQMRVEDYIVPLPQLSNGFNLPQNLTHMARITSKIYEATRDSVLSQISTDLDWSGSSHSQGRLSLPLINLQDLSFDIEANKDLSVLSQDLSLLSYQALDNSFRLSKLRSRQTYQGLPILLFGHSAQALESLMFKAKLGPKLECKNIALKTEVTPSDEANLYEIHQIAKINTVFFDDYHAGPLTWDLTLKNLNINFITAFREKMSQTQLQQIQALASPKVWLSDRTLLHSFLKYQPELALRELRLETSDGLLVANVALQIKIDKPQFDTSAEVYQALAQGINLHSDLQLPKKLVDKIFAYYLPPFDVEKAPKALIRQTPPTELKTLKPSPKATLDKASDPEPLQAPSINPAPSHEDPAQPQYHSWSEF